MDMLYIVLDEFESTDNTKVMLNLRADNYSNYQKCHRITFLNGVKKFYIRVILLWIYVRFLLYSLGRFAKAFVYSVYKRHTIGYYKSSVFVRAGSKNLTLYYCEKLRKINAEQKNFSSSSFIAYLCKHQEVNSVITYKNLLVNVKQRK